MPANEAIPFYKPGQNITGHASVALTGKRGCVITGNRQSGPGLAATAEGSNYVIGLPTAGAGILGVTAHDAAAGEKVDVIMGGVVPILAAAVITFWQEVEVLGDGRVQPRAGTNVAIGRALTGAASAADAEVLLYLHAAYHGT
jgi:hypothetical protein